LLAANEAAGAPDWGELISRIATEATASADGNGALLQQKPGIRHRSDSVHGRAALPTFVVIGLVFLLACAPLRPARSGPDRVELLVDSASAMLVAGQVAAYNDRDLERFLSSFAPDVQLYAFPDSLLYTGRDTLRVVYGRLFADAGALHARVTHRLTAGRWVVDREITTGLPGHGPLTGLAIYEVRDGQITRVWFLD
jgi:hypothetical protein